LSQNAFLTQPISPRYHHSFITVSCIITIKHDSSRIIVIQILYCFNIERFHQDSSCFNMFHHVSLLIQHVHVFTIVSSCIIIFTKILDWDNFPQKKTFSKTNICIVQYSFDRQSTGCVLWQSKITVVCNSHFIQCWFSRRSLRSLASKPKGVPVFHRLAIKT
jgi:hypothetical protein